MPINKPSVWTFPREYAAVKGKMCFLCRSTENLTSEHIFPEWLLRRYDLWKERLPLANGRMSTFERLKLRACLECNRDHLGKQLEDKMSAATAEGYEAVKALSERTIFLWVAKIYLALRFKELTMQVNPGKDSRGIWHPQQVERDFAPYMMLRAVRGTVEILDPVPYSVLVIDLHEDDPSLPDNFSHYDNIAQKTFAIQIGFIGLVVVFDDLGISDRFYNGYLDRAKGRKLTFHQYMELYIGAAYGRKRLLEDPYYGFFTLQNVPEVLFVDTALSSLEAAPWNPYEYASFIQGTFQSNPRLINQEFTVKGGGAVDSFLFRNRDMRFLDGRSEEVTYIPPLSKSKTRPVPRPSEQIEQAVAILARRKAHKRT